LTAPALVRVLDAEVEQEIAASRPSLASMEFAGVVGQKAKDANPFPESP